MSKKEIILGGLDCAHCAEVINDKVSKLEEIESCNLNFINKKLTIEIACDLEIDKDDVVSEVIDIINDTEPGLDIKVLGNENTNNKKVEITLGGLNCAHCSEEIGNKVSYGLVIKAMEISIESNVRELRYIKGIIKKWIDADIKTLERLNAYELKKKSKKEVKPNGSSTKRTKQFEQQIPVDDEKDEEYYRLLKECERLSRE